MENLQIPPINPSFKPPATIGPSLSMDIFGDNHIEIRLKREVTPDEWEKIKQLFEFSENTFVAKD